MHRYFTGDANLVVLYKIPEEPRSFWVLTISGEAGSRQQQKKQQKSPQRGRKRSENPPQRYPLK
jgi:hypothetical protein